MEEKKRKFESITTEVNDRIVSQRIGMEIRDSLPLVLSELVVSFENSIDIASYKCKFSFVLKQLTDSTMKIKQFIKKLYGMDLCNRCPMCGLCYRVMRWRLDWTILKWNYNITMELKNGVFVKL
jgi:hypothetical protein